MILFGAIGCILMYAYLTMQPQPPIAVFYGACIFLIIALGDLLLEMME
ncbi:MAG: hypothetical protein M9918_25875 [Anaerolineae bacterium]|nr:hypothetical protein [Anaerolineae bacterium]